MSATKKGKEIVVAVSGGFDPLHVGHVRMFEAAKKKGDKLIVIVNNDNWLRKKKGYVFMSQDERVEIIKALRSVDDVFVTLHASDPKDMSVCKELDIVRPHIFANGGDRTRKNIPEIEICKSIGSKVLFGVGKGGKIQSSSKLVEFVQFAKKSKNINHGK